jgi:LysR family transcriptional regulator, nitrogen assimilation regulatory protein
MHFRQLEYFLYVANTLNITHAANRAHVSQPALSRQILLLEDELGTTLLARKARGVVLTTAGERLAHRVRSLLANVDEIKSEMLSSADTPVGAVRLAAANSLGYLLTAPVLARFAQRYPGVSLEVRENTSMVVREYVIDDRADVAMLSDHGSFAGLTKTLLCSERLVLIAPPEAGLKISTPVPARSLREHKLILTSVPNGLRRAVDDMMFRSGGIVDPSVVADTNALIIHLVREGAGYSVLPYSGVCEMLERKAVSAAPIREGNWPWVVASSRNRAISTASRALIDLIREVAREVIASGRWPTASLTIDQTPAKPQRNTPAARKTSLAAKR